MQPTHESQLQPSPYSHSAIPNLDTAQKRSRQMRQLICASIIENWNDLSSNNKFKIKDDHNIIFEVSHLLDHPNSINPTVFTYLDLISWCQKAFSLFKDILCGVSETKFDYSKLYQTNCLDPQKNLVPLSLI